DIASLAEGGVAHAVEEINAPKNKAQRSFGRLDTRSLSSELLMEIAMLIFAPYKFFIVIRVWLLFVHHS
ncbi:hypothetical protein, partial [Oleiphilus sp. HI0079]|uniref:hypothetical protein n=1 Tax=Oleiphilus sp. HI0079 TaxID=1822254 RepID=UPI000A5762E1